MCPHMRRNLIIVPDIALYLVARGPQPQQNYFFTFTFHKGSLYRLLNLPSNSDAEM